MIAVFLSPLYILLNVFFLHLLLKWFGLWHTFFQKKVTKIFISIGYWLLALSLVIGFFLPNNSLARFIRLVGNYWLGISLYMILFTALALLARGIMKKKKISLGRKENLCIGSITIFLILAVSIGGMINAKIIRTTSYDITVEKKESKLDSLKVALIADLHLGYNIGCSQIQQMADRINEIQPDLVVIAGDFFDNEYEAIDNPDALIEIFRSIQTKYGIYACYGNHDISEKILAGFTFGAESDIKESDPRMDEFVKKSGIQLLQDASVLIEDSFYLYGRPDYAKPGRGITERKTPAELVQTMDSSKPIFVIDHEPKELAELASAGVDVDLCGHTHDGQIFPGNILTSIIWENSYGYLKKDKLHNIVTSGVGLFGPNMRVATIPEICDITVHFQ